MPANSWKPRKTRPNPFQWQMPTSVKVMVNSHDQGNPITNGVIMEIIVLRVATEIGEIILKTQSAEVTTNVIESSFPWADV